MNRWLRNALAIALASAATCVWSPLASAQQLDGLVFMTEVPLAHALGVDRDVGSARYPVRLNGVLAPADGFLEGVHCLLLQLFFVLERPLGILVGTAYVNQVEPLVFGLPLVLAWLVGWVIVGAAIVAVIYALDPANADPDASRKEDVR